ncbi:MAG: VOC family protein [Planctomycetota bacterium]
MSLRLVHANMTVRDIDASVKFLRTAFPQFKIRHDGEGSMGRYVHVGTDETYIAVNQSSEDPEQVWHPYSGRPGVNHLGYEVDDVDALRERLLQGGYEESTVPNNHPHRKRIYFHDPDGNDWEFVQYLSDEPHHRHDYELPD